MSFLKMSGPVGFIGVGIMGKGMLKNLVTKLDFPLIIWNR
jgi:3-hydroxyisobutyrate dehydrogenase-like beta-hydroxyacid dehydrogenase